MVDILITNDGKKQFFQNVENLSIQPSPLYPDKIFIHFTHPGNKEWGENMVCDMVSAARGVK